MRRAISIFTVGVLLSVAASGGALAAIAMSDHLDGSTLGTPTGITYGAGKEGQAAVFDTSHTDMIEYAAAYFPLSGTISFYVKGDYVSGKNVILHSIPATVAVIGDFQIGLLSDNRLRFEFYTGEGTSGFNRLESASPILGSAANDFTYVTVSYGGAQGQKLWINGVSEGTLTQGTNYTGNRYDRLVYAGCRPTKTTGIAGSIDWIRTSNVYCDQSLMAMPAVPEPSSLLALIGGLLPAAALIRRRK